MLLLCLISGAGVGFYHGETQKLFEDIKELQPTLLVGLPGAFRQLYRKYNTVQRQWSYTYRKLFLWAWQRKRLSIATGQPPRRARLIDWLLFRGGVASRSFLGGKLRYVILFDRDLPSEVRDFLQAVHAL